MHGRLTGGTCTCWSGSWKVGREIAAVELELTGDYQVLGEKGRLYLDKMDHPEV